VNGEKGKCELSTFNFEVWEEGSSTSEVGYDSDLDTELDTDLDFDIQPATRNPQLATRNSQLATRNSQPATRNPQAMAS
jgi:hypothetical protein